MSTRGVSAGGVCQGGLPGGCLPGGVSARGVSARGGLPCDLSHHAFDVTCMLPPHQLRLNTSAAAYILLAHCMLGYTSPPCGQTDTCKLITLPETSFAAGNKNINCKIYICEVKFLCQMCRSLAYASKYSFLIDHQPSLYNPSKNAECIELPAAQNGAFSLSVC